MVVIEILSLPNGDPVPDMPMPAWIRDFTKMRGLTICHDIGKAREFKDHAAAWDFYTQELPQGLWGHNESGANRPLTAFTVKIYSKVVA